MYSFLYFLLIIALPPVVTELIPAKGKPGDRVVVIGNNFSDDKRLKIKFGDVVLKPEYFESGTLVLTVPQNNNSFVTVTVANDGKDYCQSDATFTYT